MDGFEHSNSSVELFRSVIYRVLLSRLFIISYSLPLIFVGLFRYANLILFLTSLALSQSGFNHPIIFFAPFLLSYFACALPFSFFHHSDIDFIFSVSFSIPFIFLSFIRILMFHVANFTNVSLRNLSFVFNLKQSTLCGL